eukprot:m.75166 g.75166  ORF g.75166 m.75166 type:complete len:87 (+) comp14397_c1_seq5:347-607(+)
MLVPQCSILKRHLCFLSLGFDPSRHGQRTTQTSLATSLQTCDVQPLLGLYHVLGAGWYLSQNVQNVVSPSPVSSLHLRLTLIETNM